MVTIRETFRATVFHEGRRYTGHPENLSGTYCICVRSDAIVVATRDEWPILATVGERQRIGSTSRSLLRLGRKRNAHSSPDVGRSRKDGKCALVELGPDQAARHVVREPFPLIGQSLEFLFDVGDSVGCRSGT